MRASVRLGLAVAAAFAASGPCIADPGMRDGENAFTDFRPGKTRAQVNQEYMDAHAQGLLPRGDAERWVPAASDRDIGARGTAGSRYQGRTREEVMEELREHRRTSSPNGTTSIYFGE